MDLMPIFSAMNSLAGDLLIMINKLLGLYENSNKATWRVVLALGISLLLHLAILSNPGMFDWPRERAPRSSLQIRLNAPEIVPDASAASRVMSIPEASWSVKDKKAAVKKESVSRPAAASPKPVEQRFQPPVAVESNAPSPQIKPAQADQSSGIPLPGLTGPAKQADIAFEFYSGANKQLIGSGVYRYASVDGEHYGVSIKQSVRGKEGSGEEPWQLEISGVIGRQGLNPQIYEEHDGGAGNLMALKSVSDSSPVARGKVRKGRMRDGILDRQSLLFHFMLQPPELAGGKLWLSDGVAYGMYTYRLGGTESLNIPALGGVRALILILSTSESSETIELWLLPDLRYLPAKVRYTDKQGVVSEQVATSLEFK
jgi:hypothetical protein